MESRSQNCRFGKRCHRLRDGRCNMNHICNFGSRCRFLRENGECKFIHPEIEGDAPSQPRGPRRDTTLKKWLIGDLDAINMTSLNTVLQGQLECKDLETLLQLMKRILNSDKNALKTNFLTGIKNAQTLSLINLKTLRDGFPTGRINAQSLDPVI